MVDEKQNKNELEQTTTEIIARIVQVANLVDQISPEHRVGEGIRELADKLKGQVTTLAAANPDIDVLDDFVLSDAPKKKPTEELKELAIANCLDTFRLYKALSSSCQSSFTSDSLKAVEVLGTHARELLNYLATHKMME